MNALLSSSLAPLPGAVTEAGTLSTGETVLFWVVGAIVVLAALALVFARKAAHAAISLVLVMVCLAMLYVAQDAPFLGVVQIVVYTGAVMVLFLFVLMMIGVDHAESKLEILKGQRFVAGMAGLGLVSILAGAVVMSTFAAPAGLEMANADSNPTGVARVLFSEHAVSILLAAAMLVVAAVGALTLSHRQKLRPVLDQRATAEAAMEAYAEGTGIPNARVNPGVYARGTSATQPALSAAGKPIDSSVPTVLRIRGQVASLGELSPETVEAIAAQQAGHGGVQMHGGEATRAVGQATTWGMAGEAAPKPAALEKQRLAELEARAAQENEENQSQIEGGEDK